MLKELDVLLLNGLNFCFFLFTIVTVALSIVLRKNLDKMLDVPSEISIVADNWFMDFYSDIVVK